MMASGDIQPHNRADDYIMPKETGGQESTVGVVLQK
jgi:hypothetical protein